MTLLIIGLVIFIVAHMVPSMGGLRSHLISRIGEEKYKGIYGLVSMTGFGLIIWGYIVAPFQDVWVPFSSLGKLVAVLMLLSVISLVASAIASNIKRIVRHPQIASVALFSLGHLLVNGDLASIILFGSFLVFTIVALISALVRKSGSNIGRQPFASDIKVVVIAVIVYAALVFLHPYLFDVPAILMAN